MGAPKGHPAYNVNGEGGRPRKYTIEFIEKEAEDMLEWIKKPGSIYYKEFALERGYSPQRFHEFRKLSDRFAEVFETISEWQETKLLKGGLLNEFNATMTKYAMSNICGWSERTETKVSGNSENPLHCIVNIISGKTKDLVEDQEEQFDNPYHESEINRIQD